MHPHTYLTHSYTSKYKSPVEVFIITDQTHLLLSGEWQTEARRARPIECSAKSIPRVCRVHYLHHHAQQPCMHCILLHFIFFFANTHCKPLSWLQEPLRGLHCLEYTMLLRSE